MSEQLRPRPRVGVREKIRGEAYPNFRDHGKTVDAALLHVLASLQRRYGEAFASESGLRAMIWQDIGHMPGVDTIPTALERLQRQGLLEQQWLRAGGVKPDGTVCAHGTRLITLAVNRHHRRGLRVRNRRDGVTGRVNRAALATLAEARARVFVPARPVAQEDARQRAADAKREDDLRRARELAQEWDREATKKPPD